MQWRRLNRYVCALMPCKGSCYNISNTGYKDRIWKGAPFSIHVTLTMLEHWGFFPYLEARVSQSNDSSGLPFGSSVDTRDLLFAHAATHPAEKEEEEKKEEKKRRRGRKKKTMWFSFFNIEWQVSHCFNNFLAIYPPPSSSHRDFGSRCSCLAHL